MIIKIRNVAAWASLGMISILLAVLSLVGDMPY